MQNSLQTNWQQLKLSDVCYPVSDTFSFSKNKKFIFINTGDIEEGRFLHRSYFNDKRLPGQAKKSIKKEDILYSEIRPKNKHFAFIDFHSEEYVVSTKLMVIRNKSNILPKFLYLILTNKYTINNFQAIAESRSGTFPQLTFDSISNYMINLPSLKEQEEIFNFVNSLSSKIELNNKIAKTLEDMAQTIFKEWFVTFKFPGYKKVQFVNSKLGKIPKGWSVRQFTDIVKEVRKSVDPKNLNSQVPYLGIEHLPKKSLLLKEWGYAKDVISTKLYFSKGDILFGKIRPYFHKIIVAPMDGVCSSDILVMKPAINNYFGIALSYAFSNSFVNYSSMSSQGTNMPRAKWEALAKYPVIIPDDKTLDMFNQLVISSISKIESIIIENQKLTALRDLLLPKLMKGEIKNEY